MCKLQVLNKTYKLLPEFSMKKINSSHFANFLTWYEVETYTKNTPLKEKLIRDAVILVLQILLATNFGP